MKNAPDSPDGAANTVAARHAASVPPLVTEKLSLADGNGGEGKSRPARSNSSPTALQDLFLNGLRRENIDVVLYFTDGSQERGVVRAFDTFTLLLENRNSGKSQLIYKHAVTRIFPVRTPSEFKERAAKTST